MICCIVAVFAGALLFLVGPICQRAPRGTRLRTDSRSHRVVVLAAGYGGARMSHFAPLDQKAHEAANNGKPVEDYCRNCGYEFMDHYNGKCPEEKPPHLQPE